MERKEKEPKVVQPARFGSAEHDKTLQPKSNKSRDKQELQKQTKKQGAFSTTRSVWVGRKPETLCYY